jgi:flagellar basal-body rod protein FlgC
MINAIQIALSGLMAASKKTEASASNIANLQSSGSLEDTGSAPYSALTTKQSSYVSDGGDVLGVRSEFVPKNPPFVPAYGPDSPFADEQGFIGVPNVNLAEEAVNLKLAELSFKANAAIIKSASELQEELLSAFDDKV